ncbi:MAG: hypothetical protein PHF35_01175 [Candidatus Moranbacteria bacterium]|nr:hypothetical protein [Candidatus Moranbacteria bacterium]
MVIEKMEEHRFSEKGLYTHYRNILQSLMFAMIDDFEKLEPVETYEEYLKRQNKYEMVGRSNRESKREVDRIVAEFNNDLPRIKEQKDVDAVKKFIEKTQSFL